MAENPNMSVRDAADKYNQIAELSETLSAAKWANLAGEMAASPLFGQIQGAHNDLQRVATTLGKYMWSQVESSPADTLLQATQPAPTAVRPRVERTKPKADDFERTKPQDVTPQKLAQALQIMVRKAESDDGIEQRPHQQLALSEIVDELAAGTDNGIVDIATSGGKSYIISLLAAAAESIGYRTLIVSPTKTISDQLHGADSKKGLGRFTDLVDRGVVANHFDGARTSDTARTVVSTYQSLTRFGQDGSIGNFDLILYDESHLSLGDVTSRTLDAFSPHAVKMGFSATHGEAANTFHSLPIREAIDSGITAPVQSIIYKTGETIQVLDPNMPGLTTRELQQLSSLKNRNNAALEFAQDFVADGRQGVVACLPGANMTHPKFMAAELNKRTVMDDSGDKRQIIAESVGNHNTSEENTKILQDFEAGKVDVLTFVKAIELGWDSNAASFLINVSATTSMRREAQLLGRIIRKKPSGLHSIIVDMVDRSDKQQVTALHVLGEKQIDSKRILGPRGNNRSGSDKKHSKIHYLLNPSLYARIAEADGMALSDLYFKEIEDAAKYMELNATLTAEGMPEEFSATHGIPPHVVRAFHIAVDGLASQRAHRPSNLPTTAAEVSGYVATQGLIPKYKQTAKVPEQINNYYTDLTMRRFHPNVHDHIDPETADDAIHNELVHSLMSDTLSAVLSTLSERAAGVIRLRHGLNGEEPRTLDEVARVYGVTRERIRQIETKAMAALRHPSRSNVLRDYLD